MKRRLLSLTCSLLLLAGSLLLAAPTPGRATTGPSSFLPTSRYNVPLALARLYIGRYQLISAASGTQIRTGAMGIEINDRHQLYGVAQFSGYDQSFQSLWIATLYNFHRTTSGVMVFDVLAQTGGTLLGRMFLTRTKSGDLTGQIELANRRFAIAWHKSPH